MPKFVIEHKLNEDDREIAKEQLEEAMIELRAQMQKTFDGWDETKEQARRLAAYTVVGVAALSFTLGYLVGKSKD